MRLPPLPNVTAATVGLLLLSGGPAVADEKPDDRRDAEAAMEADMAEAINAERQAAGLDPLELFDDHDQARDASQDRADGGEPHALYRAHIATDQQARGQIPGGEIQGTRPTALPASHQVGGWYRSEEHRDIMLHPDQTHVAVGVICADTSAYSTAMFLRQPDLPAAGELPDRDLPAPSQHDGGAFGHNCRGDHHDPHTDHNAPAGPPLHTELPVPDAWTDWWDTRFDDNEWAGVGFYGTGLLAFALLKTSVSRLRRLAHRPDRKADR